MTATISPVPKVGQQAPEFTLNSTSGQPVTLSALRGKNVLLAFFPLAFTSVCTAELCDMRDEYDAFASKDVVILPISVDSVDSLREFKNKHNMRTEFVSDFKRDVSRLYGTLLEEKFFSNRAYFLLDRTGVIRWAHVEERPGLRRQNSEIFGEIAKLT
jgi:glutaredoxin-dependent peroxiredoxin